MTHRTAQTFFLGIIAAVTLFAALRMGQAIFAPMLTGFVVGIVCAPLANTIGRLGLPRALGSLLILMATLLLAVGVFLILEPTASRAIQNAPTIWREMTDVIATIRSTLAGVADLQETVADVLDEPGAATGGAEETFTGVNIPGIMDALAVAPTVAAALLIFAGTFYFFLLSRDSLYRRIERSPLPWTEKMLCLAEMRVSRYFLTITMINAAFGVIVGVVMSVLGMPEPVLWGLAAFLFNFVLYLGPACLALALLVTGIVSFDGAFGVVPAILYVSMNMTEGQFVTPALVGRQMRVNPLMVFASLVFWLWLWGPIGGVVAIPVLVWTLYLLGQLDWDEPTPDAVPEAPR